MLPMHLLATHCWYSAPPDIFGARIARLLNLFGIPTADADRSIICRTHCDKLADPSSRLNRRVLLVPDQDDKTIDNRESMNTSRG